MALMMLKATIELLRVIRLVTDSKLVSSLGKELSDKSLNVETTKRKRMSQSKW